MRDILGIDISDERINEDGETEYQYDDTGDWVTYEELKERRDEIDYWEECAAELQREEEGDPDF